MMYYIISYYIIGTPPGGRRGRHGASHLRGSRAAQPRRGVRDLIIIIISIIIIIIIIVTIIVIVTTVVVI